MGVKSNFQRKRREIALKIAFLVLSIFVHLLFVGAYTAYSLHHLIKAYNAGDTFGWFYLVFTFVGSYWLAGGVHDAVKAFKNVHNTIKQQRFK